MKHPYNKVVIGSEVTYQNESYFVHDMAYKANGKPTSSRYGSMFYLLKDVENSAPDLWVYCEDVIVPFSVPTTEEPSIFQEPDISLHLRELGDSMVQWLDGLEARPDNDKLPEIITYLLAVQWDKEGGYGSSWCGKGEYRGIMSNIDRKYDRLDKIVNDEITGKRPLLPTTQELTKSQIESIGESKIDAVADLANYCLLYLTWLRKTNPGAFKLWVDKNVPIYLHEKIPFIENYYR